MKKLLYLLIPIVLLGCDDGDIITNDFEFEGIALQACEPAQVGTNIEYVFHKTDNTNRESLVLSFNANDDILVSDGVFGPFSLDTNNSFQYRRFNEAPGSDYYCNSVPPVTPRVVETLDGEGGRFQILTVAETPDDDIDGIPADQELNEDTDGDGIINALDSDDDGDNVPTAAEGVVIIDGVIDMTLSRDTDGDGLLDYLDNDDDNDGILTIQEDLNRNLNPTDDLTGGSSNYLNPNASVSASPEISAYNIHILQRNARVSIMFEDLVLANEEKEILLSEFDFGDYLSGMFSITFTPAFN
ncbi:hypothetical protein [Nonlabens xiamenensis]|uniref:hypothetical protein n=1 Tax=Nonlabens xiamenensis TaxID=2341043 RepID=UPI000F60B881|nr:hypothetical protein [Nonlabens xiamenensis]